MFTSNAKNLMLSALGFAFASLHTDYPGQSGNNEVAGGSPAYARQAISVNAASGEQRVLNAAVTFNVPVCVVRWLGFWDNASNFLGYCPNGGSPKVFVVDLNANTIRSPSHGFGTGTKVVFYNATIPTPLVQATIYFVINPTTDTFQVSATSGGSAITLLADESAGCLCSNIIEDTFAAQGTESISAAAFSLSF